MMYSNIGLTCRETLPLSVFNLGPLERVSCIGAKSIIRDRRTGVQQTSAQKADFTGYGMGTSLGAVHTYIFIIKVFKGTLSCDFLSLFFL